jgi:hypothetical protein
MYKKAASSARRTRNSCMGGLTSSDYASILQVLYWSNIYGSSAFSIQADGTTVDFHHALVCTRFADQLNFLAWQKA